MEFFKNAPQPIFKGRNYAEDMEIAEGCFRHIKKIFTQLEVPLNFIVHLMWLCWSFFCYNSTVNGKWKKTMVIREKKSMLQGHVQRVYSVALATKQCQLPYFVFIIIQCNVFCSVRKVVRMLHFNSVTRIIYNLILLHSVYIIINVSVLKKQVSWSLWRQLPCLTSIDVMLWIHRLVISLL